MDIQAQNLINLMSELTAFPLSQLIFNQFLAAPAMPESGSSGSGVKHISHSLSSLTLVQTLKPQQIFLLDQMMAQVSQLPGQNY